MTEFWKPDETVSNLRFKKIDQTIFMIGKIFRGKEVQIETGGRFVGERGEEGRYEFFTTLTTDSQAGFIKFVNVHDFVHGSKSYFEKNPPLDLKSPHMYTLRTYRTAEIYKEKLHSKFPDINIAGPFEKLDENTSERIKKYIRVPTINPFE